MDQELISYISYLSILVIVMSTLISSKHASMCKPYVENHITKLIIISQIVFISFYSIELSLSLAILLMTILNLINIKEINNIL